MWGALPKIRMIPALLGATLLALAMSGCVHHSGSYYSDGYGVAGPQRAPAHGHRYHRDGAVLVFATSLDSYVVQGYTHHYFHHDRYYRYHRGRWEAGPRLRGQWVPTEVRALPHGLRRHRVDALRNHYWRAAAKDRRDDQREVKKERPENRRKVAKWNPHDQREAAKDLRHNQREKAKDRKADRREAKKSKREDKRKVAKKHRHERREDLEDRDEEERDASRYAASRVKGKKRIRGTSGRTHVR